jgi:hypothetical protein
VKTPFRKHLGGRVKEAVAGLGRFMGGRRTTRSTSIFGHG